MGGRHGYTYETCICMLIFVRGFTRNMKKFRLEYEVQEAGKFDDVVFDEGDENYQLIQMKHKMTELKITSAQLFNDKFNTDYNLIKYVKSFKDVNLTNKFKNKIKMAVVFTNIEFDLEDGLLNLEKNKRGWYEGLKSLQLRQTPLDSCAIFNCLGSDAKYYKFDGNEDVVQILKNQAETLVKDVGDLSEHDIRDVLKYIIYAVGQPNYEKLIEVIKSEIKTHYGMDNVDDIIGDLEKDMEKWCDKKPGPFPPIICFDDAEKFFQHCLKLIFFDVQPPMISFTGRLKELTQIKDQLNKKQDLIVSQTAAISGLGGMGKTQLARQFIKEFGKSDFYGRVIWISAENDSAVANSFLRLGERLKIETLEYKHTKTIIDEVFDYFEGFKVLFVFDNYDTTSENDKEKYVLYCRQIVCNEIGKSRPYFLFTSRNNDCLPNVEALNLGALSKEDAVKLVENEFAKIEFKQNREDVEQLTELLQNFPLALQQAISYIKEQQKIDLGEGYDIQSYFEEFEMKKKDLLNYNYSDDFGSGGETTFITWNVTFDALNKNTDVSKIVKEILKFLAFLYADEIEFNMLLPYFKDESLLRSGLALLDQYSIITISKEKTFCQIHRLVQTVIQMKFESEESIILEQTLGLVCPEIVDAYLSKKRLFINFFPEAVVAYLSENWLFKRILNVEDRYKKCIAECQKNQILHMMVLSGHFKKHKNLHKKYKRIFEDVNGRYFEIAAFEDDVDKLKSIVRSYKRDYIKGFVEENIDSLVKAECNQVIKYFEENGFIDIKKNINLAVFYKNIELFTYLFSKTSIHDIKIELFFSSFIEKFVEKSSNINVLNIDGWTVLHVICSNKYKRIFFNMSDIQLLLDKGIDVNARDKDGETALCLLVQNYYSNEMCDKALIVFRCLVEKSKFIDEEILLHVIEHDISVFMQLILEKQKVLSDFRFKNGQTLLSLAIKFKSIKILFLLKSEFVAFCKEGCFKIDNETKSCGKSLLISFIKFAVYNSTAIESIEYNKLLKKNGVKVKAQNVKKALSLTGNKEIVEIFMTKSSSLVEFLLYCAIKRDDYSEMQKIYKKYFFTDEYFPDKRNIIEFAIENVSISTVMFLKEDFIQFCTNGGDPNKTNDKGETLLIKLLRYQQYKNIQTLDNVIFLVTNGIDVNVKDSHQKGALLYATIFKNPDIFLYLLDKTNAVEEEILDEAILLDNLLVVKALFKNHFDTHHIFTKNQKTPIELAIEFSSPNTALYLKDDFEEFLSKNNHQLNTKMLFWLIKFKKVVKLEDVKIFIENGVNVNETDAFGTTVLSLVIEKSISNEIFTYLLRNVSVIDAEVLMRAVYSQNTYYLSSLIFENKELSNEAHIKEVFELQSTEHIDKAIENVTFDIVNLLLHEFEKNQRRESLKDLLTTYLENYKLDDVGQANQFPKDAKDLKSHFNSDLKSNEYYIYLSNNLALDSKCRIQVLNFAEILVLRKTFEKHLNTLHNSINTIEKQEDCKEIIDFLNDVRFSDISMANKLINLTSGLKL